MKKLLALLLALLMLLSLAACGDKENPEPAPDDGPGGLEDVSDEPIVDEDSPYPGEEPLGGETASGQVITIPEVAEMEYIGSKVVNDDYGNPALLSWFNYKNISEYEDCAAWCMTIYGHQNGEELWTTTYTYNGAEIDDSFYEEIGPGDELEVCMIHELLDRVSPVTLTFNDSWEELEPVELTVDLSQVEICMDAVEGLGGMYMAQYLYAEGNEYDYDMLVENGYAENSYVELYDDNTGVMCVAGQAVELMYDDECFYIGEQELYYTLEDGVLTVEDTDLYYEFAWVDPNAAVPEEEEDEDFVGETVTTPAGYVSITLDKGWYVDEEEDHGYTLVLYNKDLETSKWVKIMDNQLTSLEQEMEYTQLALADSVYEEVTIGGNTYQKLYDDEWLPLLYLVAETSTGKAFVVEVRNIDPQEVMTMLESIEIH